MPDNEVNAKQFTFASLIQQGYKILPTTADKAEYGHILFGSQTIAGTWCPNCDKPLLHLATIDTRDPRLGLSNLSLVCIPLLYCMRCAICQADGDVNAAGLRRHCRSHSCSKTARSYTGDGSEFFYHVSDITGVSILVYNEGYDEEYLPYPDFPDYFPGAPVTLVPISEEELWYCQRMNRYQEEHPAIFDKTDYQPREMTAFYQAAHEAAYAFQTQYAYLNKWTHQLGGEPCFWNPPSSLSCPCCGAEMPFLAMIEDNESAGTPDLSGGEGGQITFHFCPSCSVIGAYVLAT